MIKGATIIDHPLTHRPPPSGDLVVFDEILGYVGPPKI